jgi:ferrochelatase
VVEIPRALWLPLLHGVILQTRPAKSAAKYESIWTPEGSPLLVWTARQAALLQERLDARGHSVLVRPAMRYGKPATPAVLDALRAEGVTRILVLPLYPQYAAATTASAADAVMTWAQGARRQPELRFVAQYHDDPGYIAALASRVQDHWREHGRGQRLVLSFHGVPHRSLLLGDPYHCQCQKTARLLQQRLGVAPESVLVTFQSRFGKARWLEPYTEPTLVALAGQGIREVDVMCPGFATDCLETLEEIAQEAREAYLAAGGQRFSYISCLNDCADWIDALAAVAERHLQGWPTGRTGPAPVPPTAEMPPQAEAEERRIGRERALALGAPD